MRGFSKVFWAGLLSALFASLLIAWARHGWEQGFQGVEITVNVGDLRRIASIGHGSLRGVLDELRRLGLEALSLSPRTIREFQPFFSSLPLDEDETLSLTDLKDFKGSGFRLYWRLDAWVPPERFPSYLDALLSIGPRGFILGSPLAWGPQDRALELWPRYLEGGDNGVLLGLVEFVPPPGRVKALYERIDRRVVWVHLLKLKEQAGLSHRELIRRYLRAIQERNVRIIELRAPNVDQVISEFIELKSQLLRRGFRLGDPSKPRAFKLSAWVLIWLWLGTLSGIALMVARLFRAAEGLLMVCWGLGLLLGVAAFLAWEEPTRQVAAWLTASLTPIGAFLLLNERITTFKPAWKRGSLFLLMFSTISLLGGLLAAAYLSEDLYFLRIELFRGVKAALVLPLVGIALLARRSARTPFRIGEGLLWAALALVVTFMLIRSENDPLWPATGFELELRSWLEGTFGVRPRFKEFLIGHPLLMLWGALGAARLRPWSLGLLLIGMIGQVSIINSFMHLHTPIGVTLLRTFHGLWLGAVLGGLLGAVLRAFAFRPPRG